MRLISSVPRIGFRPCTPCRGFGTTGRRLGISPYARFLQVTYQNKTKAAKLKKMPIAKRAAQLSTWWKTLPRDEMLIIKHQARIAPSSKRKTVAVKPQKPKRKLSAYNRHVKTCMKSKNLAHLPVTLRMKAAAKLWKLCR